MPPYLHLHPPNPPAVLTYFEDNRVAMWLVFSDVWNAVVEELRAVDVVSDEERDNLLFVHLDIDPSIEVCGTELDAIVCSLFV